MPTRTIREYHPESGALLGNVSTLDFGTVTAGSHSRVKVIDIVVDGVSSIGNVKLGLVSTGGITVTASGVDHFGIESSAAFSASKANSSLTEHFQGVNSTGLASDSNNISVGTRTDTVTHYIYLDIELGSSNLSAGNGAYKLFLDYS